jgi:hypothetical protein
MNSFNSLTKLAVALFAGCTLPAVSALGDGVAPHTQPTTMPATQSAPVLATDTETLKKLADQDAVVVGDVDAIKDLSPRVLAITFKGSDKGGFVGVTFADKYPAAHDFFESDAGKKLAGQHVQVSGKISLYHGKPEIIISDPAQVKVIDDSK